MTEVTLFECNVTGERYGAKNDVVEFDLIRRRAASPWETYTETVHVSMMALDEHDVRYPSGIQYLGVERDGDGGERVAGMCSTFRGPRPMGSDRVEQYHERDSVVISHYESFFELVEAEVLY